jgi:hypothetical protein
MSGARETKPSLMAVLTFMVTAFLTANLAARWLA